MLIRCELGIETTSYQETVEIKFLLPKRCTFSFAFFIIAFRLGVPQLALVMWDRSGCRMVASDRDNSKILSKAVNSAKGLQQSFRLETMNRF